MPQTPLVCDVADDSLESTPVLTASTIDSTNDSESTTKGQDL